MTDVLDYAIVGAGMAGIGMSLRLLKEENRNFRVFERADQIGGTWRDNSYPGCSCDVPSHLYWFGFEEEQPDWSRKFAMQPEILKHIEGVAVRHKLHDYIQLNTSVESAHWNEGSACWAISLSDGIQLSARILIPATGQLGEPSYRDLPGRDSFEGVSFHSARWNHDADLQGKRVAIIGSGASAAQIVPEIAKTVAQLKVFQRSAPYIIPRDDRPYTDEERAYYRSPDAMRQSRAEIFTELETRFETLKPGSEGAREGTAATLHALSTMVSDPQLRAKLTPDYTLGCKRPVVSDDYLPSFNRPNVELITHAVRAIEPTGVRTVEGELHEADVIVYATGFETLKFLSGIAITGRGGQSLHDDAWAQFPQAYLGMTVPKFPNMFVIYGPNTNLNHNSIIAMFDAQFEYILAAGALILKQPGVAYDLKQSVLDQFNSDLQNGLKESAFVTGCHSWYIGEGGRVVTNWWGNVAAYQSRAKNFDDACYVRSASPAYVASDDWPDNDGGDEHG